MVANRTRRSPIALCILLVVLLMLPLLLCTGALASGYAGWYGQSSGSSDPLAHISAADANNAWAVGSLSLRKTTDGGATWVNGYPTGSYDYRCVDAVDANVVWVGAGGDHVLKTINGGTDWNVYDPPVVPGGYVDIKALDQNTAWLIGEHKIFRTITGGASWEDVSDADVGSGLRGLTAISATTAWVAVYDGTVMKTINGGTSWSLKSGLFYLESIDALNANVLYACGFDVFKSVNGGATWNKQYTCDNTGPLSSVEAVDANTAWVAGYHGQIAKTLDGGSRWYSQVSGTTADYYSITTVNANTAWVSGGGGVIRHTTDGGGYHTPPAVGSITPNSGRAGAEVTLRGSSFGYPKSQSYVSFGGVEATEYTAWADDEINVKVPDGISGQVNVVVHTAGGASNVKKFTVFTPTYYSYYFAEGCTREGFDEWLCLQNPGAVRLSVQATYMLFGGAPVQKTYTIPPASRLSVNVNAEVGPGQDVSTKLVAEGEFYAERPMYFDYKANTAGYGWTGGHCVTGAPAPGSDWYFAEGTTREGFEEWVCLQNPGGTKANVTVDYISAGAYTVRKEYNVDANSRLTVFANGDVGPNQDVSVHVHSNQPIVAERPIYFNYHGKWNGGHIVMGTDSPKTLWYFAEGSTQKGFEEWLAVQNANNADANVQCHFMKSDGSQVDKTYKVGANSRWTLDVSQAVGKNQDTSVIVESDQPVVAERPMYFCYKEGDSGYGWTGGHDVVGSAQVKTDWFFAEGCTLDGFDEYICVGNPGAETATVTMTFMLEKGNPVVKTVAVDGHKRVTVKVADLVGRGHDVSAALTSTKPVVAERPMYFNYGGKWNGGHDVIGF